jgi:hypothetical protein
MQKRILSVVAVLASFGASTIASAATATLDIDTAASSGRTFDLPGGGVAFEAPFTLLQFVSDVTNDVGAFPLPPSGSSDFATVDLVARTADGEAVVNTQTLFAPGQVRFALHTVNQSAEYFARLNANAGAGVAAPVVSTTFFAPSYLLNHPNAFRSAVTNRVTFSGFFSDADGVNERTAVRVLVQRRKGSAWKTLLTLAPNAARNWSGKVPVGALPAVFRVRTIPLAPARYVKVTEFKYCVARTKALATNACRSVKLGPG